MPYFSFILKESFYNSPLKEHFLQYNLKPQVKYFSKSSNIWRIINKKIFGAHLGELKYEERKSYISNSNSILFFMPPSIGLGDSIEYALSVKSIINKKIFKKVGIAFAEKYEYIFTNLFKLNNVYKYVVEEKELSSFDTTFHFSKEIKKIVNQKYDRSDIEKEINLFFDVEIKKSNKNKLTKVKKITLFPVASSPLRTMPINIINSIISKFKSKIEVEIVIDDFFLTSKYLLSQINPKDVTLVFHNKIQDLINIIKNIEYGIFVDSGPLHIAKVLNKNGLFIETTVSEKILIRNYENIETISNLYKSQYCSGPCGLTNLFNLKNVPGCYETHSISKAEFNNIVNKNALQRGILKNKYMEFIEHPVNCIKNIDLEKILNTIENKL